MGGQDIKCSNTFAGKRCPLVLWLPVHIRLLCTAGGLSTEAAEMCLRFKFRAMGEVQGELINESDLNF